jgi:hypothetical protein
VYCVETLQKGVKIHMQYCLNISINGWSGLIDLIFPITVILLLIGCIKFIQQKSLNKELQEYINYKDQILEEFKKIRHEYNNLLQTVTSFIDSEDMQGLEEYNVKLLAKTQSLNINSIVQLVKIKNKVILSMIYKLYMEAKETEKTINLTIYNDITETGSFKTKHYKILNDYLKYAYRFAAKEAIEINLKISANDMGFCFCFENSISAKSEIHTSDSIISKRNSKMSKTIFFNTFLKNDYLIQEILISFNC